MPEVQDIFATFGNEYRSKHKLSIAAHKAMNAIMNCRTEKLGGHLDVCPECGFTKPSYNSCRNRHCPKCQTIAKEKWIDNQKYDLLNVGYFHVVFTVPDMLNTLILHNQEKLFNLLFRAVAETLQELSLTKNIWVRRLVLLPYCIPGDKICAFIRIFTALFRPVDLPRI